MVSRQAIWARSKKDRERQERLVQKALVHLSDSPIVELVDQPLNVTTELRRRGLAQVGRQYKEFGGTKPKWWEVQEIVITEAGRANLAAAR